MSRDSLGAVHQPAGLAASSLRRGPRPSARRRCARLLSAPDAAPPINNVARQARRSPRQGDLHFAARRGLGAGRAPSDVIGATAAPTSARVSLTSRVAGARKRGARKFIKLAGAASSPSSPSSPLPISALEARRCCCRSGARAGARREAKAVGGSQKTKAGVIVGVSVSDVFRWRRRHFASGSSRLARGPKINIQHPSGRRGCRRRWSLRSRASGRRVVACEAPATSRARDGRRRLASAEPRRLDISSGSNTPDNNLSQRSVEFMIRRVMNMNRRGAGAMKVWLIDL